MSDQKNSLGMDEKTASWFAYILSIISAIILLGTDKDNKTVRTHAWQSLIMGICFFVAIFIIGIIAGAFFWIAPILFGLFEVINSLLGLAWFVLTIICIVQAVQGSIFKIPVIYDKAVNMK